MGRMSFASLATMPSMQTSPGKECDLSAYEVYVLLRLPLPCCQRCAMHFCAVQGRFRRRLAGSQVGKKIIVLLEQTVNHAGELPGDTANRLVFPDIALFRSVIGAQAWDQAQIELPPQRIVADGSDGNEPHALLHLAIARPGLAAAIQGGPAL